jgi:hypothetical protein
VAFAAQTAEALPEFQSAQLATNYVRSLQNNDGGFPDFAASSNASATLEAVFALTAYGTDPVSVEVAGNGPDDYLATQAVAYSASPGGAAKLVAGLGAMDIDPASFGGIDVLAAMEANFNAVTGKYGGDVFAQSLYMLAKAALGQPVPSLAADYLQSLQLSGGGWEYCCAFGADTNATAIALRALIAAGVPASDPDVLEAITYLHANQQSDGGFPFSAPGASDPNSTAYVIQAIIALGQSAESGGSWDLGGDSTPLEALVAFQNPATGALQYFGSDSPFATYQGVPGLMLAAFPELSDKQDKDSDGDGCSNSEEAGATITLGGQRNPSNPWDFYDVNSSRRIDAVDIGLVRANFNGGGPTLPEDVIFDRSVGAAMWAPGAPDNKINAVDIALVRTSFNHNCQAAP